MKYHREFTLSSCHFNGADIYKTWNEIKQPHREDPDALKNAFRTVLTGIHGHNFKIVVDVENDFDPRDDYLVDDIEIESVVMQWHNTNLSLHPDFENKKLRATTENMAHLLVRKLAHQLTKHENLAAPGSMVCVVVHETADIYAEAAIGLEYYVHQNGYAT
jgi:6-pyruvoyl-tetrahydropterin synthase